MSIAYLFGRAVTALVFSSTLAFATENRSLNWSDLVDQSAQTYEDPFVGLNYDQLDNLREIITETAKVEGGGLGGDAKALSEGQISAAKELLAEDGIDADWLISQRWVVAEKREAAANAGNPSLDGTVVEIGGFVIPAPRDQDGSPTAYLVEMAGMCSHTPSPPPNQLIRIKLGREWAPEYMYQPVRLTGLLNIDPLNRTLVVVDGDVHMKSTWRLDLREVEASLPRPNMSGGSTDWVEQLRAKLGKDEAVSSE